MKHNGFIVLVGFAAAIGFAQSPEAVIPQYCAGESIIGERETTTSPGYIEFEYSGIHR